MRKGFTVVELVAVLVVTGIGVGMAAVVLSARGQSLEIDARARGHGKMKEEEVNAMNLVKAMDAYAEGNKGWYPGLSARGQYAKGDFKGRKYGAAAIAANEEEQRTGAGCTIGPGAAMAEAILLEEGATAPAQWFSPGERDTLVKPVDSKAGAAVRVEPCHSSFAMLAYGRATLKPEWKSSQNQQSVRLASRMVFGGKKGQHSSLWTEEGSGSWRGAVVRGDGSVQIESTPGGEALGALKYGSKVFAAAGDSDAVVGIFARHGDMANFDATEKTGVLGSAMDGAAQK